MSIENTLWVEKYRPSKIEDYIGNEHIKRSFKKYIEEQELPTIMLHGPAGTGKTTAAKMLVNNIECDYIIINASDENNIETIRTKVKSYASTVGLNGYKIIILDEMDGISLAGQKALRFLIEEYSKTTRFILTCNFIDKVINPLLSRCQVFKVEPPNNKDIVERLEYILKSENLKYKVSDLDLIVGKNYPDVRKCIQLIQQNVFDGELCLNLKSVGESNYENKILELLLDKKNDFFPDVFPKFKQIIVDSNDKSFESLFSYMYEHIEKFKPEVISLIIPTIAEYQYYSSFAVDKEIPAMAMIEKIHRLINE